MSAGRIRFAEEQDALALLSIYAPYVTDTVITFEYDIPSLEEFARRIREITAFYPWLVWEQDGEIMGFAYAHRHMERAAYQWGCELSVYLSPRACGYGIGTALYQALIRILEQQHVYNLYACVTLPNDRSQRLHTALGFTLSGVWRHTGYKHGAWHDVGWFERTCTQPFANTQGRKAALPALPEPLISVHDLDPAVLDSILISCLS